MASLSRLSVDGHRLGRPFHHRGGDDTCAMVRQTSGARGVDRFAGGERGRDHRRPGAAVRNCADRVCVDDDRGRRFRDRRGAPARRFRAAQSPARPRTFPGRLAVAACRHRERHSELDACGRLEHTGASQRHDNVRHRHDGADRLSHPPGHVAGSIGRPSGRLDNGLIDGGRSACGAPCARPICR